MLSVQTIVLRSEARWFPRFVLICRAHLKWVMNPEEQDYEWMQRLTECSCGRQVQSVKGIWTTDLLWDTINRYKKGNILLQELRRVPKNLGAPLVKTHPLPPAMQEV